MKVLLWFLLNFMVIVSGYSQKDTSRQFDAKNLKELFIVTDEVYRINISTYQGDKVMLTTHAEGEYYNNISIIVKQLPSGEMNITSNFPTILQSGYDKLSAHKVFSLGITLKIPEGLKVYIESNIASVNGSGKYGQLEIELKSGFCNLRDFLGNAVVNTYTGAIDIETKNTGISASTRHGNLDLPPPFVGKYHMTLTSINGDIRVREN